MVSHADPSRHIVRTQRTCFSVGSLSVYIERFLSPHQGLQVLYELALTLTSALTLFLTLTLTLPLPLPQPLPLTPYRCSTSRRSRRSATGRWTFPPRCGRRLRSR